MAELILGPLLRYVSTSAATVWVETDAPCTVQVCGASTHTFTCEGHHVALVVLDGLEPGAVLPYDVRLDERPVWPPPGYTLPPPVVRTLPEDGAARTVAFGSCRAVGPDTRPGARETDVDALQALARRMLDDEPTRWPDLLVMLGDQVYADEPSPRAARRMTAVAHTDDAPEHLASDFEQYTWLYREAWEPELVRWVLSVVPSTMIFDDHDMIDDWNISAAWVGEVRRESWWREHVVGGLVSYWVYQHLGNLSPEALASEGLLERCVAAGDATDLLREWALESERFTPVPGGYTFSFERHLGDVHVVVIDARNGRVLEPGGRRMVDDEEWAWIRARALEPCRHLVLATSLPVFVPGGLHGLQQWNEAWCDGAAGRWLRRPSERLRRALDLEDWPAFDRSFRQFEQLLVDVAAPSAGRPAPRTVSILSGDIHFAYVADVTMPAGTATRVRQVVCSPLHNALAPRDRKVIRFGVSRLGRRVGRLLARLGRRGPTTLTWELSAPPVFRNNIGRLRFEGDELVVRVEAAEPGDGGGRLVTALEIS